MEYLPPVAQSHPHMTGAGKYTGPVAREYDSKREQSPKWKIEQRIIEDMLSDLPPDSIILDAPIGTGRFLPFCQKKKFRIIGLDLSGDMLLECIRKLVPGEQEKWVAACNQARKVLPVTIDDIIHLQQGDVRRTGFADKSVDCAINCRITRWLSPDDCQVMIREMQRVCRQRIIWTARIANHPHARTLELFEAALDGWKIAYNEIGADMDYRIIMAEPA